MAERKELTVRELDFVLDRTSKGLSYPDVSYLLKKKFGKEVTPQAIGYWVKKYKKRLI